MSHEQHGHQHPHGRHGHGSAPDTSVAELAGFLAGLAQLPRRVVDLGCGTGADAVFLAEQGLDVVGIDASDTSLQLARERAQRHGVQVAWTPGDVLELPLADGSVDLALDRGCLHHVAPEHHGRYAAEVARVLRPGGTLLVRELNHPGHHALAVTEESLRAMVDATPLVVRSITTYGGTDGDGARRTLLAVFDRA